jgi:hypothetical protein
MDLRVEVRNLRHDPRKAAGVLGHACVWQMIELPTVEARICRRASPIRMSTNWFVQVRPPFRYARSVVAASLFR